MYRQVTFLLVQEAYFKLFRNISSSGHIIYIGYSFSDDVIFNMLKEMKTALGEFSWKGYAIFPSEPSQLIKDRLKIFGITWVMGDLDSFIKTAISEFGANPISTPLLQSEFHILELPVSLPNSIIAQSWGKYEVLTPLNFAEENIEPNTFFEQQIDSFFPYKAQWDYPRRTKLTYISEKFSNAHIEQNLETFLMKRRNNGDPSDNISIILTGIAGSGKTVAARRIAFDWYLSGNPVILIRPNVLKLDIEVLQSLIEEIWNQFQISAKNFGKDHVPTVFRYLLLVDEGGPIISQLSHLPDILMAAGRPADVLLVDRLTNVSPGESDELGFDLTYGIDDTIEEDETDEVVLHFSKLGVIPDMDILRKNLKDRNINSSFFSFIYSSVKGVQKTLRQLIVEEYSSLEIDARRVYSIASLLHSLGLDPSSSLIIKSLGIKYDWFYEEINGGRLRGVVKKDAKTDAIYAFNKTVADIICSESVDSPKVLYSNIDHLISAATAGDLQEENLLHLLLIERLNKFVPRLTTKQRSDLLMKASNTIISRTLLLHLGRLQVQSNDFDSARLSFEQALAVKRGKFNEDERHVYDQIGRLELRLSEKSSKEGKKDEAYEHLVKADDEFRKALRSPSLTPHPYYGIGETYEAMAELADSEIEKWSYLLLALDVCNYFEEYVGTNYEDSIDKLKKRLISNLINSGLEEDKIDRIESRTNHSNALAFLSEIKAQEGKPSDALKLAKEAFESDDSNLWAMRQYVYLLKQTVPLNHSAIKLVLEKYSLIMDKRFDIPLSLELAIELFTDGSFQKSRNVFAQLNERTENHPNHFIPKNANRLMDGDKRKEFLGILTDIPVGARYGRISCNELSGWYGGIPVRSRDVSFAAQGGERVYFSIIFDMVGPQASQVRFFHN